MLGKTPVEQKLLVPVDGSRASIRAVEHVISHAGTSGTRVHLVNVQQPIMAGDVTRFMSARGVADMRRAAGEQALRTGKSLLDAHDIDYTAEVVFGSPAEAIARCAAERHCTKIVMGTRGRSLFGNLVARSVTSRVVRLSPVPVTLIKDTAIVAPGVPCVQPSAVESAGRA